MKMFYESGKTYHVKFKIVRLKLTQQELSGAWKFNKTIRISIINHSLSMITTQDNICTKMVLNSKVIRLIRVLQASRNKWLLNCIIILSQRAKTKHKYIYHKTTANASLNTRKHREPIAISLC